MSPAAVRMLSSSSSRVVDPSARAAMVRVLTTMGSTPSRPSAALATALTILLRFTGSRVPLRLRTLIDVAAAVAGSVSSTATNRLSVIVTSNCPSRFWHGRNRLHQRNYKGVL